MPRQRAFFNHTRYPYVCECQNPTCRRRVVLTHREYLRRAADGPVLSTACQRRERLRVLEELAA